MRVARENNGFSLRPTCQVVELDFVTKVFIPQDFPQSFPQIFHKKTEVFHRNKRRLRLWGEPVENLRLGAAEKLFGPMGQVQMEGGG